MTGLAPKQALLHKCVRYGESHNAGLFVPAAYLAAFFCAVS
jgi:hypothetical protein